MADQFVVGIFVGAFALGVRSTWHLRAIHHAETPPRNLITRAFYLVSLLVTIAAGFYGFLGARRVLGFDPIPGAAIPSIVIASAVVLIPVFLDWTVQRIRASRS